MDYFYLHFYAVISMQDTRSFTTRRTLSSAHSSVMRLLTQKEEEVISSPHSTYLDLTFNSAILSNTVLGGTQKNSATIEMSM